MWTRYEEEDPKYPLKPQVWTRPKLLQRSPVSPKFAPSISDILVPRIWNARTQPGDSERPVVIRNKHHRIFDQHCSCIVSRFAKMGSGDSTAASMMSWEWTRESVAASVKACPLIDMPSLSMASLLPIPEKHHSKLLFWIFSFSRPHHSPFWCCFDGSFCILVQLQVLLGYLGALALLGIVLPGPTISGALLADKTRLQYKCNGKSIFW